MPRFIKRIKIQQNLLAPNRIRTRNLAESDNVYRFEQSIKTN
jgi:hypothetical protein